MALPVKSNGPELATATLIWEPANGISRLFASEISRFVNRR